MQRKCGKPERCVFIPQPHSMRVESSECRRLCLHLPAVPGEAAAPLGAQCLSNPQPCWEDRSVRGGRLRRRKHKAWNVLQNLQASTHATHTACTHARTDTHNRSVHTGAHAPSKSLPIPLYFPAQSSCSQMASWVWGSATPTLFVDGRWFFHAIKALPLSPVMPGRWGVGTLNLRFRLNIEDRCECSMWRGRWYNV